MAIQVAFLLNDESETHIAQSTLECVPRVGEIIWFVPSGTRKARKVTEVCHWIAIEAGNNYHKACVYLKEISREKK